MLAIVAAVIFAVAFVIRVTRTATGVVFAPDSLLLAGLASWPCTRRASVPSGVSVADAAKTLRPSGSQRTIPRPLS